MITIELVVSIVKDFTLVDNVRRSKAEYAYQEICKANPNELPHILLEIIELNHVEDAIRSLCAVLLRRLLIQMEKNMISSMNENSLSLFQTKVLVVLDKEENGFLKARICDIVNILCNDDLTIEAWPELLPFTYQKLQSTNIVSLEIGLALLGMVSPNFIDILLQSSNISFVLQVLGACLTSTVPIQVGAILVSQISDPAMLPLQFRLVIAAIRCFREITMSLQQETDIDYFIPLLTPVLNALQNVMNYTALGHSNISTPTVFIENMIDIAEESLFFTVNFPVICAPILTWFDAYAISPNNPAVLNPVIMHLLSEFLVASCFKSGKTIRKLKGPQGERNYFVLRTFPIFFQLMARIAEDSGWESATEPEEDSNEGSSDADVAESVLDRMAQALGLKSTYPVCSTQLLTYFQSGDWRCQYAALRFLGSYVEVTKGITDRKQLLQHQNEVLSVTIRFAQSPHARVRAAAYYALNQFLMMHGPVIRDGFDRRGNDAIGSDMFMGIVLPNLLRAILASTNPPRTRRCAMFCIINIVEVTLPHALILQMPPKINNLPSEVEPFYFNSDSTASTILRAVVVSLQQGPVMIQQQCVSVIMSLTEHVKGNYFAEHYDGIMPLLKQLVQYCFENSLEEFWGQVIECIAMVGESSGKNKFYKDATELMNNLVTLSARLGEESEIRRYILRAWVRIARCLSAEFLPFLQVVMTKLFQAVSQDANIPIPEDADDATYDELEQRSDVQMIETSDGEVVAVRSAIVEEQASACQLLVLILEKFQEHMYPYVEQLVMAVQTLLNSPHDDVRSYAMVILPELVRATAKATSPDRTSVLKLSDYLLGLLLKAVECEIVVELVMTGLESIKHILYFTCVDWQKSGDSGFRISGLKISTEESIQMHSNSRISQEPQKPFPKTSTPFLNVAQMNALVVTLKVILRDSLQRRAVLRAEHKVSGADESRDEEDALCDEEDEQAFMTESLQLHFAIADVIGAIFRTHGELFWGCYMEHLHQSVFTMTPDYCAKEDRQFALFIIADVLEFGAPTGVSTAQKIPAETCVFLESIVPIVIEICKLTDDDGSLRQAAAYILGISAQRFPPVFASYSLLALQALSQAIQTGESLRDEVMRGPCTDNCVAAVGNIVEHMGILYDVHMSGTGSSLVANEYAASFKQLTQPDIAVLAQIPFDNVWAQWLEYLPLKCDDDEWVKVLLQCSRLFRNLNHHLFGFQTLEAVFTSPNFLQMLAILLDGVTDTLINDNGSMYSCSSGFEHCEPLLVTKSIVWYHIIESIQLLKTKKIVFDVDLAHRNFVKFGMFGMKKEGYSVESYADVLIKRLYDVLKYSASELRNRMCGYQSPNHVASSPLATAPIFDILMRANK